MSLFKNARHLVNNSDIKLCSAIPVVFLSYDEPNAETNFEHLKLQVQPSLLKRVHGVKGFDAAHKAAADCFPGSNYIFTVDGDTQVMPHFWTTQIPTKTSLGITFTWGSRQNITGLMYGNGGIKLWNRDHLLSMKSHENSDSERDAVDFCWDEQNYQELTGCYSITYSNASKYQAFRSGFREGIKMCLAAGGVIDINDIKTKMHAANYQRLLTWLTVGSDVENGIWSILGTRVAVEKLYYDPKFDYTSIRDYDWFLEFFSFFKGYSDDTVNTLITQLSIELSDLFGFRLPKFNADQSSLIKQIQLHPEKPLRYEDVVWRTNLSQFGWFK